LPITASIFLIGVSGAILALCAYDQGYFVKLTIFQIRIELSRRLISDLVSSPGTDPAVRDALQFVEQVKKYAQAELGLAAKGQYTTFVQLGRPHATYSLSATPLYRLDPYHWRYPIVGRLAYKGFFLRVDGLKEEERLRQDGYDTYLRGVSAYSTLGWFKDPIFSSMIGYARHQLADLIIHELTHTTLYVDGDTDFNESLATFIGKIGAKRYLGTRFGSESAEYRAAVDAEEDAQVMSAFVDRAINDLKAVYKQSLTSERMAEAKKRFFIDLQHRLQTLNGTLHRPNQGWVAKPLNNSLLLSLRRYHRDLRQYERYYQLCGSSTARMLTTLRQRNEHGLLPDFQHWAHYLASAPSC